MLFCILLGNVDEEHERMNLSDNGPSDFSHLRAALEQGAGAEVQPLALRTH